MGIRYLGVDLGTKRIGLALSEPEGGVVSPLAVIQANVSMKRNAAAIIDVADEYDAGAIVIGLPFNMDGTEGSQAKLSRSLAKAIEEIVAAGPDAPVGRPLSVHLHDERLTSHAADQRLAERDLTRRGKKARQDAVAAQILLESFLQQRPSESD
jgi:putative holliday junction resolvase